LLNFDLWYTKRIKIEGEKRMPKDINHKKKLLALRKIFLTKSDEAHPLTMEDIIRHLSAYEISAERKSIYRDLEVLDEFIEICRTDGRAPMGYYTVDRAFELAEIKILIDSIQASKFITKRKSDALITKRKALCSEHEAKELQRQPVLSNRIKNMNESILYTVDTIQKAMAADKQISFKYYKYNVKMEKDYFYGGTPYLESPFALISADDCYYLLAYSDIKQKFKHYRVDKMESVKIDMYSPRKGKEAFAEIDLGLYTKRSFSMYGGKDERVTMRFKNYFSGVVVDRFGKDVYMKPIDSKWFEINEVVTVSPLFFGWILSLGAEAQIVGPEEVKSDMAEYLMDIAKLY